MLKNQCVIKHLQIKQIILCLTCNVQRHRLVVFPIDAFDATWIRADQGRYSPKAKPEQGTVP